MSKMVLPVIVKAVGVSNYQVEVRMAEIGQKVLVEREPDNPYDKNACALKIEGQLAGYLPKPVAAEFAATGETYWAGAVYNIREGKTWGFDVKIFRPMKLKAAPEIEEPAEEIIEVKAKSGRILGQFMKDEGSTVLVRSAKGTIVPYPKEIVSY